jgi:hypothetical protein
MDAIDYTIYCSHPEFSRAPAKYKLAAEWTGGGYSELKTYGFANDECIEKVYRDARTRLGRFRPGEGESVGELRIYVLDASRHDYELDRATELEKRLGKGAK